jgi:hypothetical protein
MNRPVAVNSATVNEKDPQQPLRVLLPLRLDVLGRAMDSGVWQMWLELDRWCELVPFGPGFDGWTSARGAGAAARECGADVLLLGDLTHSIPGLWDELWGDVAECGVPTVMFVSDPGSATEARIEALDRYLPDAILTLGYEPAYARIDAAALERGISIYRRDLGHDEALFFPPTDPNTARDIDILVCGAADPHAYPVRRRIQSALRSLSSSYRVMDLTHPGYWETSGVSGTSALARMRTAIRMVRDGGPSLLWSAVADRRPRSTAGRGSLLVAPERHGQATFAELVRRSRIVVTGTTFGIVSAKHYEVAACGAVGVGDMPDQPEAARFAPAMLRIDERWSEARIATEVMELLDDEERWTSYSLAATAAVHGYSAAGQAHSVVRTLEAIAGRDTRTPERRSTVAAALPAWTGVLASSPTEPLRGRSDWIDGRQEPLIDLLAQVQDDIVVLASTPEAALPPDASWLAAQLSPTVPLARRPMQDHDGDGTWCLCAVRVNELRAALTVAGSTTDAIARLIAAGNGACAPLGGFLDPTVAAAQREAYAECTSKAVSR